MIVSRGTSGKDKEWIIWIGEVGLQSISPITLLPIRFQECTTCMLALFFGAVPVSRS
jgi:hypothetical protein